MDNFEEKCKHNNVIRNCYYCYLNRNDNEPVNFQDMIFTTLSELQVRISKLEEYKRLQDDLNKYNKQDAMNLYEFYYKLDEHRKKQIDENRAVSKHLDQHDEKLNILLVRMDALDLAIKLATEFVPFDESDYIEEPKTTGLTFEEAITQLKSGKNITIKGSNNYLHIIMDHNMFSRSEILSNDWEILE